MFVVQPPAALLVRAAIGKCTEGSPLPDGFRYASDTNPQWLSDGGNSRNRCAVRGGNCRASLMSYQEAARMRILVTGASGLLGLNLALERRASGHDRRSACGAPGYGAANRTGCRRSFPVTAGRPAGPWRSWSASCDQTQPEWVIHCAALASWMPVRATRDQARQLNSERRPAELAELVARGGARACAYFHRCGI